MQMGKLTAKLRDAVPVCLLVDGKEIKRYKNIEIPDELKALEYHDFKFDVPAHGAITFKVMFALGVLPEVFPKARERKSRKTMGEATTALGDTTQEDGQPGDTITEAAESEEEGMGEGRNEAITSAEDPATMEIAYHATGERRKELVKAISQFTGVPAIYQNAPTFAFAIGNYTVDKAGTLTGKYNAPLVEALAEQGFIAG